MREDADIKLWRNIIEPLSKKIRAISGGVTQLTARLQKRCPNRKIHRQQVETWLHRDPEKRGQPQPGMALLLIAEAGKMIITVPPKESGVPEKAEVSK